MKRFKMDRSGQIPLIPKSEEGSDRWSVHPAFVVAIAAVMVLAALALAGAFHWVSP
jgi:hypothetical protein